MHTTNSNISYGSETWNLTEENTYTKNHDNVKSHGKTREDKKGNNIPLKEQRHWQCATQSQNILLQYGSHLHTQTYWSQN